MTKLIYPHYYTILESGVWKLYKGVGVTEELLAYLSSTRGKDNYILLERLMPSKFSMIHIIHALAFENTAAGSGNFARWDVISCFTTTLKEAKRNFPNSPCHGKQLDYEAIAKLSNMTKEEFLRE